MVGLQEALGGVWEALGCSLEVPRSQSNEKPSVSHGFWVIPGTPGLRQHAKLVVRYAEELHKLMKKTKDHEKARYQKSMSEIQ